MNFLLRLIWQLPSRDFMRGKRKAFFIKVQGVLATFPRGVKTHTVDTNSKLYKTQLTAISTKLFLISWFDADGNLGAISRDDINLWNVKEPLSSNKKEVPTIVVSACCFISNWSCFKHWCCSRGGEGKKLWISPVGRSLTVSCIL